MDQKRNIEVERLNAALKVDGPGPTREERAIEVLQAMLFTLNLGMNDMMAGAECAGTLGRLLHRTANILNMVCGRIFAPPCENLDALIKDCQEALATMKKARKEEYEARRAQVDERYCRMAAGMGDEPGPAPAN